MQQAAAFDSPDPGHSDSIQRLIVDSRVLEITHDLTGQGRCHVFDDKTHKFLRLAGFYVGCSRGMENGQKKRRFSIFPPRRVQHGEEGGVHLHCNFDLDRWSVKMKSRRMRKLERTVPLQFASRLLRVRRFQIGGGGHNVCWIRYYAKGRRFRRRIYRRECRCEVKRTTSWRDIPIKEYVLETGGVELVAKSTSVA